MCDKDSVGNQRSKHTSLLTFFHQHLSFPHHVLDTMAGDHKTRETGHTSASTAAISSPEATFSRDTSTSAMPPKNHQRPPRPLDAKVPRPPREQLPPSKPATSA
ncbi:hypothetical protein C8Q80DRAFT_681811 [Daedaleopsis nitida]|nr:hypothetical protein C8Q80DRAFT_681811 [Daedaleopsis nitida]